MSEATANAHGGPPDGGPAGPPPWIRADMQQRMAWRDGDIVVAVPPKSGTTWTMNIVHQLRSGGDADFADIYGEVPWIEFFPTPDSDVEAIVAALDAMPGHRRRAFKTHSAPPALPYVAPGEGPAVSYVVVGRDPEEALASFRPFIAAHSDEFMGMWGVPTDMLVGPDFATFAGGMGTGMLAILFSFVEGWWPLRDRPNVHFVHYSQLLADPATAIDDLAGFLGFEPTPEQWPVILEHTSFAWMKEREEKFELTSTCPVPVLDRGAMLRKGKVGTAAEDGVTPEISAMIEGMGRSMVTDPAAIEWIYRGVLPGGA
jgi:aryl sulfotransferase